jgi:hypothetical protein
MLKNRILARASQVVGLSMVVLTTGATAGHASDALPFLTVSYFNGSCPDGWEPMTAAKGRFLVPSMQGGGVGAFEGEALAVGETPEHKHTKAEAKVELISRSFILVAGGPNHSLAHSGTESMSGSAKKASGGLPYIQYMVCLKTDNDTAGSVPEGVMTFRGEPTCADGWGENYAAKGRYIAGLPESGSPGATFGGPPLTPSEIRTHTHEIDGDIKFPEHDIAGGSGCCAEGYAGSGTRPIHDGRTVVNASKKHKNDSAVQAPYYTAPLCRKK